MPRASPPWLELGLLLLPVFWAGLLVGVSFIATPAKFQASSLTLPVALDVGRATFAIWNNVEWLALALFAPLIAFTRIDTFSAVAIAVLGVFLLIQSVVLLPILNNRIAAIIAGAHPPPSSDHLIYIAIDILKLIVLAAMAWKQSERLALLLAQLR